MKERLYINQLMEEYPALLICMEDIINTYDILREAYMQKKKLLICGNGGSGADSEHIVGELMKEFYIKRPIEQSMKDKLAVYGEDGSILGRYLQGSLPAITLTGNIALSTAYSNDAVPELVFAQQIFGYGVQGDVLLAISTSGNSKNVIYAVETAKVKGLKTVGLTGKNGGRLKDLCDICICVPNDITYKIQELHLPIYHTICRMLEEVFFG